MVFSRDARRLNFLWRVSFGQSLVCLVPNGEISKEHKKTLLNFQSEQLEMVDRKFWGSFLVCSVSHKMKKKHCKRRVDDFIQFEGYRLKWMFGCFCCILSGGCKWNFNFGWFWTRWSKELVVNTAQGGENIFALLDRESTLVDPLVSFLLFLSHGETKFQTWSWIWSLIRDMSLPPMAKLVLSRSFKRTNWFQNLSRLYFVAYTAKEENAKSPKSFCLVTEGFPCSLRIRFQVTWRNW